jgi:CcmD family protein
VLTNSSELENTGSLTNLFNFEDDMTSLAIAFALTWTATAFYVGWIGRNQRKLAKQLDELAVSKPNIGVEPLVETKAA